MKLIRTNAVFSRIALVSCFCAENQLSGKIPENIRKVLFSRKTHGARRRGEEGPRVGQTRPRRGPRPGHAWVASGRLRHLLGLPVRLYDLRDEKYPGGSELFAKQVRCAATTRNPTPGTRNSVLAPCRDGETEEIIAIIITNASTSTIHDSPSHM